AGARPGHYLRLGLGPSGGSPGRTGVGSAIEPVGLALAAGPRGQPLVSDHAAVPPTRTRELERRGRSPDGRDPGRASGEQPAPTRFQGDHPRFAVGAFCAGSARWTSTQPQVMPRCVHWPLGRRLETPMRRTGPTNIDIRRSKMTNREINTDLWWTFLL